VRLNESTLRRIIAEERAHLSAPRRRSLSSFLFEEAGPGKGPETTGGGIKASELSGMTLSDFISRVDSDKKTVLDVILKGQQDADPDDDKAKVAATEIPIANLRPTQSEVVIDKSLPFTLGKPKLFKMYVEGDGPFSVGVPGKNDAIITLNGKFVIDGHHRWSSLFCFNPGASISAFDIQMPSMTPNQALIAAQAAIIDKHGSRPEASGGGTNLFTAGEGDIRDVVGSIVTDELAAQYAAFMNDPAFVKRMETVSGASIEDIKESFRRAGRRARLNEAEMGTLGPTLLRAQITAFCWGNVQKLQKRKPISGATPRELMPQADVVGPVSVSAGVPAALEKIAAGDVDIKKPFATESSRKEDALVMERWQRLAGILK
jgi:hypothetical protein